MEKICTYEQYSEILTAFKKGKARCSTNKLMTRNELTGLIEAGKLYYSWIDGVLWFFVNEGYFYSANFYVPVDAPIRMCKQDMDVLVELTGNQTRYNEQWERELIAAGYKKYDNYLEYATQLDAVIDDIRKQNKADHAYWEKQGFIYRKATKADYPEMLKLWEGRLGRGRYTINSMTDADLEEMEQSGRCILICDPRGKIVATHMYAQQNKIAVGFHVAALYQGQGLGSSVFRQCIMSAYEAGSTKFAAWIREDNVESIKMHRRVLKLTGKFYWQFIYKADSDTIIQ